jgi:wyosine [tRNA(Phe)-imidazoG37] synthetase (radical SAM superfamily)
MQCERASNLVTGYKYLFGPVPSRRFGRSLGVDLTPYKTCSQDCVFCQLGRTTNKTVCRKEYAPLKAILDEISNWLATDGVADYITLSGSGEPTLHARFGEVLELIRSNSRLPAVLLTNGSLFHLPEVRQEARRADIVKISLSAWDQASYAWLNRPHPDLRFDQIVDGKKAFRDEFRGKIWMEVFLVVGMNSSPADVARISKLAEQIRPDRIHLNTAVRPPAEEFAVALSREKLGYLTRCFHPPAEVIAEFQTKEGEERHGSLAKILGMLKRRFCTADEIAHVFGLIINEVSKYLGKLGREGRVRVSRVNHFLYYISSNDERCEAEGAESNGRKKWEVLTAIGDSGKDRLLLSCHRKL